MGKKTFGILGFLGTFILATNVFAFSNVSVRCKASHNNEANITMSDFRWGYSLPELLAKSVEIYISGKRLKDRAYFDEAKKAFVVPISTAGELKQAKLHPRFIESIKKHIQISLKNRYADAIIFPDMGHSHFFIPSAVNEKLNKIDYRNDKNIFYEELFSEPEVKTLYHTAEQMTLRKGERGRGQLIDDDYIHWRYYTRNVVGKNDASNDVKPVFATGESYNTLHELPGYDYFGAGFNLSASQNGCFEVEHENQKIYFDLSIEDMGYASSKADIEVNL